jgi:hypothetical protein
MVCYLYICVITRAYGCPIVRGSSTSRQHHVVLADAFLLIGTSLNHLSNIGCAGGIGKHGSLEIFGGKAVIHSQGEYIDHFVDVWPDKVGS